ncbi:calmodulin-binding protein [Streptomyces lasalocidi]
MTDITREEFVIELTDPAKIEHARELVNGETTDRPHVIGRILKRTAPYNPRWSYHYNPDTTDFFDVSIEVCDATIPYVEDHLDEAGGAFLPGLVFCPWTSRLVREIPRP